MSTPCKIILKVRKEDKGKTLIFDEKKLPCKLDDWKFVDPITKKIWGDETGENKCQDITITNDYIGIYCHWDGDLVGEVLEKNFNTYESVLNLILGGCCSYIYDNAVRHYANRKVSDWSSEKPIQGKFHEVKGSIYGFYTYVFRDDKWHYKRQ